MSSPTLKNITEDAIVDLITNSADADVVDETTDTDDIPRPIENLEIAVETADEVDVVKNKPQTYASKKSVAQRMLDIALLTSNANQLRYVLVFGRDTPYYYVSLVLIVSSLILQMVVGIFLIVKSKPVNAHDKERTNNIVVSGVLTITIINVLNTAFSIEGTEAKTPSISTTSSV